MPRRLSVLLLAVPVLLASGARAQQEPGTVSVTTFVVRGHGWGHGLGMPQWGALGMAKQGSSYDRILGYYYRGIQLGQAPPTKLRVLLVERKTVAIASAADFKLQDAAGAVETLPGGSYTLPASLKLVVTPGQPAVQLQSPVTFVAGRAPLQVGGRAYRGQIQVGLVGKKLQAVDVVGLENYLRGVVTQEMPKAWPLEALKAQAVAARSYALAQLRKGAIIYPDVRSQVYGGLQAETPSGVEAVTETKGQIAEYAGKVATTYFYSSSGGRTASYTDVVQDQPPVQYLVSVPDPYDAGSPYHNWGPVVFTGGQVSRLLHVPGVTDLVPDRAGARARQATVTGSAGAVVVRATAVRSALGLRSTWFSVGLLRLSRPSGTFSAGQAVTLTGVKRIKDAVTLEQKPAGSSWQAGPSISPAADGSFSVSVTPSVTTQYRLVAGSIRTKPLRVTIVEQQ